MLPHRIKGSLNKAVQSFINILPIVLGMILLTSWIMTFIPRRVLSILFTGQDAFDAMLGATLGSLAMGNPLASYVLGGEFMLAGVSMLAVTAFLISWVTVGVVQLPAEALMLGRDFAIYRNLIAFLSAIVGAFLVVFALQLIG